MPEPNGTAVRIRRAGAADTPAVLGLFTVGAWPGQLLERQVARTS